MISDHNDKRSSRDITNDESISILDPRRFTPTLHANLVSEILALRRDQEEKTRQIESLETALHSVKEEHGRLQESLTNTSKESRSLQRQLSLLEGGSSSALRELARERDEAVESNTDVKKRLEAAQKKIRSQEDESQRVHDLWAHDKDDWVNERRNYERKLHIAESRLKMVLDEVAAYEANRANGATNTTAAEHDAEGDDSGAENDAASVRSMSVSNGLRLSLLNGPILQPGNSLADELKFDEDDQTDAEGRESVMSCRMSPKTTRPYSRDSGFGRLHFRNQSIESVSRPGSVARSRLFMNPAVLEALEGEDDDGDDGDDAKAPPTARTCYTDTAVQYSPPPSPKVLPRPKSPILEVSSQRVKASESEVPARVEGEVEANQRRKRVQLSQPGRPLSIEPPKPDRKMVSRSAQTVEIPSSPTRTPEPTTPETDVPLPAPAAMVTASTQTDEPLLVSTGVVTSIVRATPCPAPLQIPTISIQPPTSCPTTPREPRLPQHFKHFGCQVNLPSITSTTHASVQTEGIQVDKRIALLPVHLHPSNIKSRPTSPNSLKAGPDPDPEDAEFPTSIPPRNPMRLANNYDMPDLPSSPLSSQEDEEDSFSGPADDRPMLNRQASKRINRFSSLFAGFDTASSEEEHCFADADVSDSEFRTALSAPRPQQAAGRVAKHGSFGTATVRPGQAKPIAKFDSTEGLNSFRMAGKENYLKGHNKKQGTAHRISTTRRAAMIQSGIASHQQSRSGSPDMSHGKSPPFPIPNRASSRRSQTDLNAPSDGRESPARGEAWRGRGGSGSPNRSPSIRKVRSAAAIPPRGSRFRRRGSRSPPPPPLTPSTEAPESPDLPPLPRNDITTPRTGRDGGQSSDYGHGPEFSMNTNYTANTLNTAYTTDTGTSKTVGVVDAIAQAMVGEWMLKYVRRRKSFSVAETNGKDDSSNDRHKRWVWLAPYERSILWSSKQPSSGSALLGKTGRKLMIQSVLDVKDDNSPPRVMPTVFNRSILILTPQRALKFTTGSAERHYLWLTALSFLAHSSQAVPENIPAPPPPKVRQHHLPEFELPPPRVKRGGIRDSIRLAKGKSSMSRVGSSNASSVGNMPSSRRDDASGLRAADASWAAPAGHGAGQAKEAAEPPFVPRFSERGANAIVTHGRRRSNTGGHVAPPLSFRGFSGSPGTGAGGSQESQHPGHSTCNDSVDTTMSSSDLFQTHGSTNSTWNMSQTVSERTSETSLRPGNFFDAIGTVRMEAFINPLAFSQRNESPPPISGRDVYRRGMRRKSKDMRRRNSRSRHREIHGLGRSHSRSARARQGSYSRAPHPVEEEDYFVRDDPFKGF
ncbi:hypothetical protein E4U16_001533 [Claviceps sp. LM84 group G4]|nr:hypothetical protein E4U16_001533 [Claviceps sp. LM84 group G4]